MNDVYITALGAFLPGEPVGNDDMEEYLGRVHGRPSRARARTLAQNGIQTRHYAIDKQQRTLFRNSQMAALAVKQAAGAGGARPGRCPAAGRGHHRRRPAGARLRQHGPRRARQPRLRDRQPARGVRRRGDGPAAGLPGGAGRGAAARGGLRQRVPQPAVQGQPLRDAGGRGRRAAVRHRVPALDAVGWGRGGAAGRPPARPGAVPAHRLDRGHLPRRSLPGLHVRRGQQGSRRPASVRAGWTIPASRRRRGRGP